MAKEGVIRLVVNAVDQFSNVITGINSAIGLMGSAMSAVGSIGSTVFSGIEKAVGVLSAGGALIEARSQFENLAKSYGVNGDEIVKSLSAVAQGTIRNSELMKTASKAIVSGLSGPQIQQVAVFVKKFTEATGEDFASVADTVYKALSSGRFAVLKQMGLLIAKGDTAAKVVEKMVGATGRFGEAAYNAGDTLAELYVILGNTMDEISMAIARIPAVEEALTAVAVVLQNLYKQLDTKKITQFFDVLLRAAGTSLKAFVDIFVSAFEITGKSLDALDSGKLFTNLIAAVKFSASAIVGAFQFVGKTAVDLRVGFGELAGFGKNAFLLLAQTASTAAASILGYFRSVLDTMADMYGVLDELSLGAVPDSFENELNRLSGELGAGARQLGLTAIDASRQLDAAGREFADHGAEQARKNFESYGRTLNDIDSIAKKAQDAIGALQAPKIETKIVPSLDLEAAHRAANAIAGIQAEADEKAAEKEDKEAEKELKRRKTELSKALKAIEELEKQAAANIAKGYSGGLSQSESEFVQSKYKILKGLKEIEKAERDLLITGSLDIAGLGDLKNIVDAGNGKLTVTHKEEERTVNVKFSESIPWPAALRDLVQAVIESIVKQMANERLPLAISTSA